MNNTKRKILTGVIAALICFTMIMGSFGAILGAIFGLISNQDLIDAINNGSISVGDLALLASLQSGSININGQDVTNVSADGYTKKNNLNEESDQKADYTKYNNPYYSANTTISALQTKFEADYETGAASTANTTINGISFTTGNIIYGAQSGKVAPAAGATITANTLYYLANGMRCNAASDAVAAVITVNANCNLVLAMATAEDIIAADKVSSNDYRLNGAKYASSFTDDVFDNVPSGKDVYGIAFTRTYFNLLAGATLTLIGRDFNNNGYIDDKPVEVTITGTYAGTYWIYEKIVISGSPDYQDYTVTDNKTIADLYAKDSIGGKEIREAKPGIDRPLISVYGGTTSGTTCKLIISGADLRNNLNETIPDLTGKDTDDIAKVDDVKAGGGAIYLASGSKTDTGRNSTTCGYFSEVVITNTRFAYCGAVRGGAIMVGKNFYSKMLDISYCDFNHCYTTYYNYVGFSEQGGIREGDQSGDGGAICFYQDDSLTEDWYTVKDHNNPSLVYVGTADFTGSTFKFCYAMRAGGAIFFGGYHYKDSDFVKDSAGRITANHGTAETLGTRIETLKLDFCDFYCCGAGWAMYGDPVDGSRALVDADFIFKSGFVANIDANNRFYSVMNSLGITDIPANADVDASEKLNHNNGGTGSYLFKEAHCYSTGKALVSFNWYRIYDCFRGETLTNDSTKYNFDTTQRGYNNWYNIPQLKFPEGSREGGAIFFNCRVKLMSMKDSTFVYCATDSNGSAVFLSDYFVCPKATVENCLFKNCLSTQSFNGNATEGGTFRSRGLVAADIHFNNCSFLYNSNMSGAGALFMNLNHTYTGPGSDRSYDVYAPNNEDANGNAIRNGDGCAGTEVNNCVFFGNFSFWKGAAIKCSGVMVIYSSSFAYNMVNAGSGGAIKFQTYIRDGVNVGTSKAHMRFDINYGDGSFDGHTIVCNNAAGGNGDSNGGGGISINADHSGSVGTPGTTVTSKDGTYSSREYSFDFQLNGVLVFDNTAAGGGGGIYYRVKTDAAGADTTANAWLYDKSVILNDGYVFNNTAFSATEGGGGVRVRDNVSVREDSTKVSISGAYVYANKAENGGGLHILAEGGTVNITGGYVIANTAPYGAGIYIKDTKSVNITGGNVGITKYSAPTITVGATDTTFTATTSTTAGGNVASTSGGGIYINNAFTDETYFANDTTVTMTGGIIEANKATSDGGGLYMVRADVAAAGLVNFTMNPSPDGSAYGFYGNTAKNGAGIYASSNNATAAAQRYVVNLNGGEVSNNVASINGGGAFITGGAKLVVSGATMCYNKANGQNGGAVYINTNAAQAVISDGQIANNYAKQHGGGIQAFDAELTISGGNITGNKADTAGGGLAVRGTALLTMNGGTISANTSKDGGGVFVSGASAVANINGGTIGAANVATNNGGGVYVNDSATVTLTGGKVDGNTATQNGGGIYVTTTKNFKMDGGTISNNTATNGNGGGVFVEHTYETLSDGETTLNVSWWGSLTNASNVLNSKITQTEVDAMKLAFNNYLKANGYDPDAITLNIVKNPGNKVASAGANTTSTTDDIDYHMAFDGGGNMADNIAGTEDKTGTIASTYDNDGRYVVILEGKSTDLALMFFEMLTSSDVDYKQEQTNPITSATLASGNITGNKALNGYGGGVCCDSSTVALTANNNTSYPVINTNTAKNGGGVAVINSGDVTMQGGYVTGNSAKCVTANYATNNKTSYKLHDTLEGVGGGIYVANASANSGTSSFSIVKYDTINSGIYLNNAEFAADDVFANAVNTQLSVPAFASMHIIGDAGNVTGWFEDYAKDDENYAIGLNGRLTSADPILRYDYAVTHAEDVFEAWISTADRNTNGANNETSDPDRYINDSNAFVCVTLGAYVIYDGKLTITKYIPTAAHLDPEQTFIFHVVRTHDKDGNALSAGSPDAIDMYVTINVTDTSTLMNSVTITSLPLGTYVVTEMTDWSWRYEIDTANTKVTASNGGTATDSNTAAEVVCTKLQMVSGTTKSNDPTITFANKLTNNPWLDGNSPKVLNTLNSSNSITTTFIGGTNKATNVVLYANFKREETLI